MPDKSPSSLRQSLPEPDIEALAHSQELESVIKQRIIDAGGRISFQDFMQASLYEPALGYYRCGTQKFGFSGDFTTAPESSALFGYCLANFIQQTGLGSSILEVGAGSGKLAVSILLALESREALPDHYYILELSAELRDRQRQTILEVAPQLLGRINWLDCLPEKFTGVVLANELLDAMPVRRFALNNDELCEQFVALDNDQFIYEYVVSDDARLKQRIDELKEQTSINDTDQYYAEVNFIAEDWLKSLGESLDSAVVVLIDYGYPRASYYHAQRHMGTLMCHYQHYAHDDPLIMPGIQDITAHIDFTAMADAALEVDMEINGFATQAHFLMNLGLLDQIRPEQIQSDAAQDNLPEFLQATGEVKRLTLPGEMGESFKVMVISKQYDGNIPGFEMNDIRHLL